MHIFIKMTALPELSNFQRVSNEEYSALQTIKKSYLRDLQEDVEKYLNLMESDKQLRPTYLRSFYEARLKLIEAEELFHEYYYLSELDEKAGPIFKKLKSENSK